MNICEVRQGSGRFVFASKYLIKQGTWVLCDTRYGKQPGQVVDSFKVDDTDSKLYKKYLACMGATEPLKEVIGIFVSMETLDGIRKRNRR